MLKKLIITVLVAVAVSSVSAKDSVPTPQGILKKMATVYSSCKSYRDTGMVTEILSGPVDSRSVKPFSTAFVRPNRLRFEYSAMSNGKAYSYVVWEDAKEIHSYWTMKGNVTTEPSIDTALNIPTGGSSGAAHMIPRMLLPKDIGGWAITSLKNPQLMNSKKVDGVNCFIIRGKDVNDAQITLYINKKTYLVVQIIVQTQLEMPALHDTSTHMELTIKYSPQLNVSIPNDVFTFTPPE